MNDVTAEADRSDTLHEVLDMDPGAHGLFDTRAVGPGAAQAPRWLRFGIAAALGAVAGTMLFATEARGRGEGRERRGGRR